MLMRAASYHVVVMVGYDRWDRLRGRAGDFLTAGRLARVEEREFRRQCSARMGL